MSVTLNSVFYLVLVVAASGFESVFFEEPQNAVVVENYTAEFRCRINSGSQAWQVNGSSIDSQESNPDVFEESDQSPADLGRPIHTLFIVARSLYNGTTVQCTVSSANEYSSIVVLLIQGLLQGVTIDSIRFFNATLLKFTWSPPFSLNVTTDEPDVWYCISIAGVCGAQELFSYQNCNVFKPWFEYIYSYSTRSGVHFDMFVASVTPVNALGNGSMGEATSVHLELGIGPDSVNGTLVNASHHFLVHEVLITLSFPHCFRPCDPKVPLSYTVFLVSSDHGDPIRVSPNNVTIQNRMCNMTQIVLRLEDDILPFHRKYTAVIESINSAESVNSTGSIEFSTHSVQDFSINNSSLSGTIFTSVTYAPESNAIGHLAVVTNQLGSYTFAVSYRPDNILTITGLSGFEYSASVYDIAPNGLPATQSALTKVFTVHNTDTTAIKTVDDNFIVNENSEGNVCITCSFPMASSSVSKGCITLVHSIDQPSVLGVYNITKPVMSDGTDVVRTSFCLDDLVTTGRRLGIAVFVWRIDGVIAQTPSTVVEVPSPTITDYAAESCSIWCITASVSVGGVLLGVCITGLIFVPIIFERKCKKKDSQCTPNNVEIELESNTAYDSHSFQARSSSFHSEPVYESVY